MGELIELFENKRDFYCEKSASDEMIKIAENRLGIGFADDYKEYLKLYGSVSCAGHELTGISEDRNLDVVSATLSNYKENPNVQEPFYVIEEANIDGIVIWQTPSGEIYQSEYKGRPLKIHDSLAEYVATFDN